jgi:hypothetical protein
MGRANSGPFSILYVFAVGMIASGQTRPSEAGFYALLNTSSLVMYYGWGGGGGLEMTDMDPRSPLHLSLL